MRNIAILACLPMLTACLQAPMPTVSGSITETSICREIGQDLPTRSRRDTPQTAAEIGRLYTTYEAACPGHEGLIPQ